jgi:hypothetical protein
LDRVVHFFSRRRALSYEPRYADVFARRAEVGYRHLFMYPSGSGLAELSRMIERDN